MKNYFVDQYGAINNIDFTDVIKDVLGVNGESSMRKLTKSIISRLKAKLKNGIWIGFKT